MFFADTTAWCDICSATDEKGGTAELGAGKQWCAGIHRIHYETGLYFRQHGMKTLYPHIDVSSVYDFGLL